MQGEQGLGAASCPEAEGAEQLGLLKGDSQTPAVLLPAEAASLLMGSGAGVDLALVSPYQYPVLAWMGFLAGNLS